MNKRQKLIGSISELRVPLSMYVAYVEEYIKAQNLDIGVCSDTLVFQDRPEDGLEVIQLIVLHTLNSEGMIRYQAIKVYHEGNPAMSLDYMDVNECCYKILSQQTDFAPEYISSEASSHGYVSHRGNWGDKEIGQEFNYPSFVTSFLKEIGMREIGA